MVAVVKTEGKSRRIIGIAIAVVVVAVVGVVAYLLLYNGSSGSGSGGGGGGGVLLRCALDEPDALDRPEGSRASNVKVWGLSKGKASYKTAPLPEVRCDRCRYMFPRLAVGGCRLVRGVIKNSATCDEFQARSQT